MRYSILKYENNVYIIDNNSEEIIEEGGPGLFQPILKKRKKNVLTNKQKLLKKIKTRKQ